MLTASSDVFTNFLWTWTGVAHGVRAGKTGRSTRLTSRGPQVAPFIRIFLIPLLGILLRTWIQNNILLVHNSFYDYFCIIIILEVVCLTICFCYSVLSWLYLGICLTTKALALAFRVSFVYENYLCRVEFFLLQIKSKFPEQVDLVTSLKNRFISSK